MVLPVGMPPQWDRGRLLALFGAAASRHAPISSGRARAAARARSGPRDARRADAVPGRRSGHHPRDHPRRAATAKPRRGLTRLRSRLLRAGDVVVWKLDRLGRTKRQKTLRRGLPRPGGATVTLRAASVARGGRARKRIGNSWDSEAELDVIRLAAACIFCDHRASTFDGDVTRA